MTLRIGTRRSQLALVQAEEVRRRLGEVGVQAELIHFVTEGDMGATPLTSPSGLKGLFVTEIVRALRGGEIDLAVHSAKDLPAEDDPAVVIAAVPERASPLDVLVTRNGELPSGGRVGTSSLRRRAQILRSRPDVSVRDLRGNVDTRLRKLVEGDLDAIVLAAAGLLRLEIVPEHAAPMSVAEMVPAPGQGCLGVQTRADDGATREIVRKLDHLPSRQALEAERGVMARLGGGCALPLGAFASVEASGVVHLVAIVASPDGTDLIRVETDATTPADAAHRAAEKLRAGGADAILAAVRP